MPNAHTIIVFLDIWSKRRSRRFLHAFAGPLREIPPIRMIAATPLHMLPDHRILPYFEKAIQPLQIFAFLRNCSIFHRSVSMLPPFE